MTTYNTKAMARAMALVTAVDGSRSDPVSQERMNLSRALAEEIIADPGALEIVISLALLPSALVNVVELSVDHILSIVDDLRAEAERDGSTLSAADVGLDRVGLIRMMGLGIASTGG